MDVHVITDANKAAYAAELDQLFRIRHRIYDFPSHDRSSPVCAALRSSPSEAPSLTNDETFATCESYSSPHISSNRGP